MTTEPNQALQDEGGSSPGLVGYPPVVLGTMGIEPERTPKLIHEAIALGYRAFDTAPIYGNEAEVGKALRTAPVPRAELFVTTKLWNACHGHDETLAAFDRTMERMSLDAIDLFLIHWPCPFIGKYVETWRALVRLQGEGRVRMIGVSNFLPDHIERIIGETGVAPAVNQIELNLSFQQTDLVDTHRRLGIATQAWSPLGHGGDLGHPVLSALALKHGVSPAQVVLRWFASLGVVPVVKASRTPHLAENVATGHFPLDADDLAQLSALNRDRSCFGVDPLTFYAPEGMEDYKP